MQPAAEFTLCNGKKQARDWVLTTFLCQNVVHTSVALFQLAQRRQWFVGVSLPGRGKFCWQHGFILACTVLIDLLINLCPNSRIDVLYPFNTRICHPTSPTKSDSCHRVIYNSLPAINNDSLFRNPRWIGIFLVFGRASFIPICEFISQIASIPREKH